MDTKTRFYILASFIAALAVTSVWAYAQVTPDVNPQSIQTLNIPAPEDTLGAGKLGSGYEVPKQNSNAEYFYLFGPEGNPLDGYDGDPVFELNVDVPQNAKDHVVIQVFDPDTGGLLDAGVTPWNTEMEFAVIGKKELTKKVFSQGEGDGTYAQFGPFAKEQGQKIGDKYRFTLRVTALSGDDLNLFKVKIFPDYAETSTSKFNFVLLPTSGARMTFYPEVPAGVTKIIVRNFDLDKNGGKSQLRDAANKKSYRIHDSKTGEWADTEINLKSGDARRLEYRVTTIAQKNGHAGLEFLDENGNSLPIYFRKGLEPQIPKAAEPVAAQQACNRFTFDGRSSSDANNDKITYKWDLGDGTTSQEPVVTHVYQKGGKYNVNLTVSDNRGLKCSTAVTTQEINVNTPPKAGAEIPELTCAGQQITLNAAGSKDGETADLDYTWRFSDGSVAKGETVTKSFDKGGAYDVVLTVDDKAGSSCSTDSIRKTIRVNTAPVANPGKDIQMFLKNPDEAYAVNFDGSKSYDADKNALSYAWDFGDGSRGEGAKIQHIYTSGGQYEAKLMVNDNSGAECATDTAPVKINLNKAPIANAGKPQAVCEGSAVHFSSEGSSDPDNNELSYLWNFGDGETGTGASADHTYKKAGRYGVTLTVNDGRQTPVSSASAPTSVFVNATPIALMEGAEKACMGEMVTFDASKSSDPEGSNLNYVWDFGDGTPAAAGKAKMTHQYAKGGTYQVRVTVDDGNGNVCGLASDSKTIKINTPPQANAGENLACCQDESTAFNGSSSSDPDGDALTYHWNFGDGGSSTDADTTHAYAKSGAYQAVLTVDDGSGTSCSQSTSGFTAHVNAKPVPVIKVQQ